MSKSTNSYFKSGKLTFVIDGQFGSSGKGKIGSYLGNNADNWTFACNAFSAQAGHWVRLGDGREYFYQHLNSIAYLVDKYEKLYIGAGSAIELPALLREIEENKVPVEKLGISPTAMILSKEIDAAFERGIAGFDGAKLAEHHTGTSKRGSTCHGVGSAAARKALRRESVQLARDTEELKPYICDVPAEISARLDRGESGLLEIAQGFPLSMNGPFYPYCTSRNVTTAAALSDMFLAPKYAGPVVINLRTLPIRINSNKYIATDGSGKHLTWPEVEAGVPHTVYEGNSGHWYPDQHELTWKDVTEASNTPWHLCEMTSVTKLPRRIATFSLQNLREAIATNDCGHGVHLSLNFANYIDYEVTGASDKSGITKNLAEWIDASLGEYRSWVNFIGTGALEEDMIEIPVNESSFLHIPKHV